jgi:pimeloyl-ACP methyl ester carboxylesterase
MNIKVVPLILAALFSIAAPAQVSTLNLVGNWQGTLPVGKGLRLVLQVVKADTAGGQATFYSIDQGSDGIPVTSLSLQGTNFKFAIPAIGGAYEGTVSADGNSIQGTWTQNNHSWPLNFQRATPETAWPTDSSPHTIQFVVVDDNVKLEVLDWGGTGRPLVLLAGLGNTAHIFDKFAPKLTPTYHVYGVTRRGFGASSAPVPSNDNYSADRLGDDVLAVLDALKLNRPVLAGHSIAGEELSSIGSRHPERVAGLIYLDGGYSYAYYDRSHGDLTIDSIELNHKLEQLVRRAAPDPTALIQDLLQTGLPQLQQDLQERLKDIPATPKEAIATRVPAPMQAIVQAILGGEQKYTDIHVPVLAIFAVPHRLGPAVATDPSERAALEARDTIRTRGQADAFEKGIPSARVVRLPHADHFIFLSNEADVLREMNTFIANPL